MVILLYRLNGSKMDCLLYRECLYRIEFGLLANLLLHTGKSEKRKDASSEADHWLS